MVILHAFPSWLHPVVCFFVSNYWRGEGYFCSTRQVLGPYIQERLDALDQEKELREAFTEPSALNWLINIAGGDERNLARLTHTETVLSLAGIHTMLLRQLSAICGFTTHPEYLEGLRTEIADLSEQWDKTFYNQLRKLDSFMRGSQGLAPPTVLGLKRIMQQPYTLQDGTLLPKGAYVCVAAHTIENEPRIYLEPEIFDGMRSFVQGNGTNNNNYTFAATETTVLGFGHGKTACPGRFFASLVIKMVVVKLITEYEFEFLPGEGRPQNWIAHEFMFASPWDRIRMRKRKVGTCPF